MEKTHKLHNCNEYDNTFIANLVIQIFYKTCYEMMSL